MIHTKKKWLLFIMPASITAEGIHIAIPLFVLFLGGNVADVGVVIAVHYGFSSIGSIFWGKIIDKYHIKKGILVICFSAISVSSLAMFFASEIGTVFVLSAIMGFFIIEGKPRNAPLSHGIGSKQSVGGFVFKNFNHCKFW